jgi:subtilisin family serine protease
MTHYNKLPEVMNIAASDANGQRAWYSNYGPNLFLNAPSGQVNSRLAYPGMCLFLFVSQ